jgi:hypothetical protein
MSSIKIWSLCGSVTEDIVDSFIADYIQKWIDINISSYEYESVQREKNGYFKTKIIVDPITSERIVDYDFIQKKNECLEEYHSHTFITKADPCVTHILKFHTQNLKLKLDNDEYMPLDYEFMLEDNEEFFNMVLKIVDTKDMLASIITMLEDFV